MNTNFCENKNPYLYISISLYYPNLYDCQIKYQSPPTNLRTYFKFICLDQNILKY